MELTMSVTTTDHTINTLSRRLFDATGVSVARCYQCGKCTAGCPMAEEMDYTPSHILRLLQLGLPGFEDKVLGAYSPWVCLTCEMCYARCPQDVDIPKMMDFLRSEAVRLNKVNPRANDFVSFHKTMLDSIRYVGRLYEVGMIMGYKARTWHLFEDIMMAPTLFFKGKLKIFPHLIKNRKNMSQIFKRSGKARKEASK
jgi:heterodisulfide reductase subunit C